MSAPKPPCTTCGHDLWAHTGPDAACGVWHETRSFDGIVRMPCGCRRYTHPREEPMTTTDHLLGPDAPLQHVKLGQLQVLSDALRELQRQDELWGEQNHPDGTGTEVPWMIDGLTLGGMADRIRTAVDERAKHGTTTWAGILLEEAFEAVAESDPDRLRAELIQTAAVCLQWALAIDRRSDDPGVEER